MDIGAINLIIAAIAPSVAAANVISIIIILASTLFGGFLLNKDSIPNWLLWAPYLSFWNYAFEALLINEFDGVKIVINPKALPGIVYPGTGKFILDQFGMNIDRFAMDVIILIALGICLIGLTGILIKYFVKEKR
jgi:ABC-type multidrug transport system permease subunit